jgi:DNA-binding winged helix-turn-helix (wHTH) protein
MLYSFGDYTLDAEHYELRQVGRLVAVEPRILNVLTYLVQHAGRTVTTEELKEQLYPHQFGTDDRLTNAVAQARKVLGDTGQTQWYIETVRRRGYRFIAPVTARPPGAADLRTSVALDTSQPLVPSLDQGNTGFPLASGPSVSPSVALPVPPPSPLAEATMSEALSAVMHGTSKDEWRPLTVLACHLVGLSEHATLLDREAHLAVVRDY